jgi:hypothetical protein
MIRKVIGIGAGVLAAIKSADGLTEALSLSSGTIKSLDYDKQLSTVSPLNGYMFQAVAGYNVSETDCNELLEIVEEFGYKVYKKTTTFGTDEPYTYNYCTNMADDYIGDEDITKRLCVERGIRPVLRTPSSNVCSIGYSVLDGKWYGWSHRAIFGFEIGHVVEEGDCGFSSLPDDFTCTTMADCKTLATNFAESVSSVTVEDSLVSIASSFRSLPLKYLWYKHTGKTLEFRGARHSGEHTLDIEKGEVYGLILNDKATNDNNRYILLHKDAVKIPFYLNAAEVKRLVKNMDKTWAKTGRPVYKNKPLAKGSNDLRTIDMDLIPKPMARKPASIKKVIVGVFAVGNIAIVQMDESGSALKRTITHNMKLFHADSNVADIIEIRQNNPLVSRIKAAEGTLEIDEVEYVRLRMAAKKQFRSSYIPVVLKEPSLAVQTRVVENSMLDSAVESLRSAKLADKSIAYVKTVRLSDMESYIIIWESREFDSKFILGFKKDKMTLRHSARGNVSVIGGVTLDTLNRTVILEVNKTIASLKASSIKLSTSSPKVNKLSMRLRATAGETEISVRVRHALNLLESASEHYKIVDEEFQNFSSWDAFVAVRESRHSSQLCKVTCEAPRRNLSFRLEDSYGPSLYLGFSQSNGEDATYAQYDIATDQGIKKLKAKLLELPLLDNGQRWYYGSAVTKVPRIDTVWHSVDGIPDLEIFRKNGILETDAPLSSRQLASYELKLIDEKLRHPSDRPAERVAALRTWVKKEKLQTVDELKATSRNHPYYSNMYPGSGKVLLSLMGADLKRLKIDKASLFKKVTTAKKP